MIESSPELPAWRTVVAWQLHVAARAQGWSSTCHPLAVEMRFVMPAPKRDAARLDRAAAEVWHHRRPDLDKLVRAVFDAMVEADVVPDDGLVAELVARKVWAGTPEDGEPGLWVHLARA